MRQILFVGEKPSKTAYERGWTWISGRLAAKTLSDALTPLGLTLGDCQFVNIFGDEPEVPEIPHENRLEVIRAYQKLDYYIVALGNKASKGLTTHKISHTTIRHPAARGAGRRKDIYAKHVADILNAYTSF